MIDEERFKELVAEANTLIYHEGNPGYSPRGCCLRLMRRCYACAQQQGDCPFPSSVRQCTDANLCYEETFLLPILRRIPYAAHPLLLRSSPHHERAGGLRLRPAFPRHIYQQASGRALWSAPAYSKGNRQTQAGIPLRQRRKAREAKALRPLPWDR